MMSLQAYFAFVVACVALALLPGPIVSLLIANGLRYGTRAALINVAGAQAGLAIVIGIVAVGLTSLMATMGYWFDWVRFAGAAYLVWLGIKLIRSPIEGVSVDDLLTMMQSEDAMSGPPPFEVVAGLWPMGKGQRAWATFDLPAGEYTVICFVPDIMGDMAPHAAHGMVRTLVVK